MVVESNRCKMNVIEFFFFFLAEGGIRGIVRSRGCGDVYESGVGSVCECV